MTTRSRAGSADSPALPRRSAQVSLQIPRRQCANSARSEISPSCSRVGKGCDDGPHAVAPALYRTTRRLRSSGRPNSVTSWSTDAMPITATSSSRV